jgi:hypothetical protein
VDLGHGGESCGILQLSCEALLDPSGRRLGEFNEYVKPPADSVIRTGSALAHMLTLSDPRIANAESILVVWPKLVTFVESRLCDGLKTGGYRSLGGVDKKIET